MTAPMRWRTCCAVACLRVHMGSRTAITSALVTRSIALPPTRGYAYSPSVARHRCALLPPASRLGAADARRGRLVQHLAQAGKRPGRGSRAPYPRPLRSSGCWARGVRRRAGRRRRGRACRWPVPARAFLPAAPARSCRGRGRAACCRGRRAAVSCGAPRRIRRAGTSPLPSVYAGRATVGQPEVSAVGVRCGSGGQVVPGVVEAGPTLQVQGESAGRRHGQQQGEQPGA